MKRFLFALLSLLILAVLNCSGKTAETEDPHRLLTTIESSIIESYVFEPEDSDFSIPALYGRAYEAVTGTKKEISSKDEVAGILANISGNDERTNAMTKAARAMLDGLPVGANEYYPPLSIAYSSDPDRKGGVGLVIRQMQRGRFLIVDSIEGSASHREGVKTGQELIAVDGKPVAEMDLDEVVGRIRGPIDSSVELKLSEQTVSLIRASVPFSNLRSNRWRYEDGFVYVFQLRSTLPGSAKELKEKIMQSKNMQAMVLDIRKVNYGNFNEAFEIADLVRSGSVMGGLLVRGSGKQMFEADQDRLFTGQVYVITDELAAPVSQVLALALSGGENVKLLGQTLDGKCFLSKARSTPAGGEIRLTEGYVLTANEDAFYKTGLNPDYTIKPYLPGNPPFDRPDPDDPAHVKLAELLKIKSE